MKGFPVSEFGHSPPNGAAGTDRVPHEPENGAGISLPLLAPAERVLSTLNRDGSRRWLRPRCSPGSFLRARRLVAYVLIAVFTVLPWLRHDGKALFLLNISAREFTLFGYTFLATDTLLLALLLVSVLIAIFLITALLGRVWCGWACPQTVYMEFIYRPLERFFQGRPAAGGAKGSKASPLRTFLMYATYLMVAVYLAHTFLAYFVGVENLFQWIRLNPVLHPQPFLVMLLVTAAMMFDFAFFREQTCILACPYGRFQSVLLDRDSLIVTYDRRRGEPRGKIRATNARPPRRDCVDCGMCVDTCPTGIDIRNGLQLECIACAQCIDACDAVMQRLGRPAGLIRYSSQSRMDGNQFRIFRARIVLYPALLAVVLSGFVYAIMSRSQIDVTILRGLGQPFSRLPSGEIENQVRVKVVNRTETSMRLTISLADESLGRLVISDDAIELPSGGQVTVPVHVLVRPERFTRGQLQVALKIQGEDKTEKMITYRLLGPLASEAGAVRP